MAKAKETADVTNPSRYSGISLGKFSQGLSRRALCPSKKDLQVQLLVGLASAWKLSRHLLDASAQIDGDAGLLSRASSCMQCTISDGLEPVHIFVTTVIAQLLFMASTKSRYLSLRAKFSPKK